MKKLIASVLIFGVVFVPTAFAGRARTDEQRYNYFEPIPGGVRARVGDVEFDTFEGEQSLRVTIIDETGLAVGGEILQDPNGDGDYTVLATFCGATKRAVRVTGGEPVRIHFQEGQCEDGGAPRAISGRVKGIFTR